ncbi:putative zinc-finger domain protein [Candidatus Kinetoplastibacterium desouzaii TCC079E]|uniref:Putative zinc-finger domain protein n=1 Tax=Candidatus Kinetoplastidibacterium desouzai TCC079E TaxID=1208919 RepID=M1M4E3_9PROT|nr:zinc-finger domain-containing protein [Candidatus Kinetoplastibacterium desouzaii]AGF47085.1 putative zinc-finger domain protein [Candidatus Kinetoplastibacterium desouzaii TCC079E]
MKTKILQNNTENINHHTKSTIHCPSYKEEIWNMHPRIILDIGNQETVKCPYCGKKYTRNDI